ncbi:MAG: NADH:ubiquinone oxidoreductase [Coriobacteriia bacterium]|nr:NADH:ubiquinone oxidoreductase [Coriobacteriia bacterium]
MAPRLVVLSLASDFGCQVNLTNMEDDLLDVLGLVDLSYWQLASSGHMPAEYDVAIIEGAVTTGEHVELLKSVRATAAVVIAVGTCANTGGIPAMANLVPLDMRYATVYGDGDVLVALGRIAPAPVDSVIDVDYHVPGCPLDRAEFMRVLSRVLLGLSDRVPDMTMCASCKISENVCFFDRDSACLGLVTRAGCGAKCPSLGRACSGCRGIAPDANLDSARAIFAGHGRAAGELDDMLRIYNSAREVRA